VILIACLPAVSMAGTGAGPAQAGPAAAPPLQATGRSPNRPDGGRPLPPSSFPPAIVEVPGPSSRLVIAPLNLIRFRYEATYEKVTELVNKLHWRGW